MERWIIFDVDGVLSPYSRSLPAVWQPWTQPDSDDAVWLSRLMGAAIADLMSRHALRGAWLTTWCLDARATTVIAPTMGIGQDWPEIPWQHFAGRRHKHVHAAKAEGLAAWLDGQAEQPGAIVWIDDQLGPKGDLDFVLRRDVSNPLSDRRIPHHLVAPDMWEGLTPDQLTGVDAWLSS